MASLFQQNSGAMHNPLLPGGDQTTASPFGFGPGGQQRASIPRDPSTRTQNPIVTGTGVLGLKFKDGVMLAADTLGTAAPCELQKGWCRHRRLRLAAGRGGRLLWARASLSRRFSCRGALRGFAHAGDVLSGHSALGHARARVCVCVCVCV